MIVPNALAGIFDALSGGPARLRCLSRCRDSWTRQLLFILAALTLAVCAPPCTAGPDQADSAATGSVVTLPADLPLWAYGYKILPAHIADYQAKCATAKPLDCGRNTGPHEPLTTVKIAKGSRRAFTLAKVWDNFGPADWFPGDHPRMPKIVAHGRREAGIRACGLCHLPNGMGLMQNGAPAGLPADYILQQLRDFREGRRQSADLNKANAFEMIAVARQLTDEEMKTAAAYFSAVKPRCWVRVVESDVTPKFNASVNGLFTKMSDETEPLGHRLVEMPEDTYETATLRNPRSGYVAYAPVGSLSRGKMLVMTGSSAGPNGTEPAHTLPCAGCHGANLRGTKLAPPIAGRPPSYMARQMYDFRYGVRKGPQAGQMMAVVRNLQEDDVIAIVAYVASLQP